ncbi:MAG: ribonuclease P protein component [Actinomycetia bacterium]|nr:ribonuclease P protein component [Actinomycetes bacterium]
MFRTAERQTQRLLTLLWAGEDEDRGHDGRVAFIAGKRLGSAPSRNRAKRLLREAARQQGAPWPERRVLLIAREACAGASLLEVNGDLDKALRRMYGTGKRQNR